MSLFVDTNILLRIVQPSHPMHERAGSSLLTAMRNNERLVLTPQIMAEFWNAATRLRENNGLGMSVQQAQQELETLQAYFSVLSESQDVYEEWKRLITHHDVSGVKAHDARI